MNGRPQDCVCSFCMSCNLQQYKSVTVERFTLSAMQPMFNADLLAAAPKHPSHMPPLQDPHVLLWGP